MNNKISSKKLGQKKIGPKLGFSLLELSIVMIVIGVFMVAVVKGSDLIEKARIASAGQKTVNSPVTKIDGLFVWFETTNSKSFMASEMSNGLKISTWYNIGNFSRVANDATAPATNNKPQYTSGVINGLSVIRFDGVDDYLTYDGSFLTNNNYTIFVVSARGNNKDTNPILGGSTTTATFSNFGLTYFLNTTARLRIIHSGDNTTNGTSGTDFIDYACGAFSSRSFQIHSLTFNYLVGKTYYENGTQRASITSNTAKTQLVAWAGSAIGRLSFNNSGVTTSFFNGDIAEIIMYNKVLTDQERKDVERYLGDKYNITTS